MSATVGLPERTAGCLFDLDGVLTSTATLHRQAWKTIFDELLAGYEHQRPFGESDYLSYVDGLPRADGVRTFLRSRGIMLDDGHPDDPPDARTVHGVGNRKNELLQRLLQERGVNVYLGSRRYLEAVRRAGLSIGVVTSSANGAQVLESGQLSELVDVRIDGLTIQQRGLRGKPAPDSFLAGAEALDLPPGSVAVFEDATAGVRAGKDGGFGCVVGVDRTGHPGDLRDNGADLVVNDLADLLDQLPPGATVNG